ncbi:MAG: hypothetical protein JXR70_02695 [Spirochaetales bacterium]|nr:hypothetical protein [Spirochaetales bacterium]
MVTVFKVRMRRLQLASLDLSAFASSPEKRVVSEKDIADTPDYNFYDSFNNNTGEKL